MKHLFFALLSLIFLMGCGKKESSISRDEIIEAETRKALRHKFDSDPKSKGAIINSLVLQKKGGNKYAGSVEITDPDGSIIKLDLEVADHEGKIFFETKLPQKIVSEKTEPPKADPNKLISDPIVEEGIRLNLKYKGIKPAGELTEADLEKVTFFVFMANRITDVGLKEVAKLQNLTDLDLSGPKITDASLREVAKLQKLGTLILEHSQITDVGLKELAKMQKLRLLSLRRTKIADAGLKEVAKMQQLAMLYLSDTKITDAGLKELAKMQQLTELDLRDTKITKEGVAELQKALPKCSIIHDFKK